jgi:hypothetical protein
VINKCETCQKEPPVAVVCVPGVPYSAAYCESCLAANAHPWPILVANTACIGGLDMAHEGWRALVRDTCAHLGRTLAEFESEVARSIVELDEYYGGSSPMRGGGNMIEGLKITVPGGEVQKLLRIRAAYHQGRAQQYRQTWETMAQAMKGITREDAPKMPSSGSTDPVENARLGMERHERKGREYEFMATYVKVSEEFLLDTNDLHRLGVLDY